MASKKVKVALFLEPEVAHDLKVRAAMDGARGLSQYITRLLKVYRAATRRRPA